MAFDLARLSILILDPLPGAAGIWRQTCAGLGIKNPHVVADGEAMWQMLLARKATPDIVICRWELPGMIPGATPGAMTGGSWIWRLRRDPASPNPFLPAIVVTAALTRERARAALDAGAHGILVTPVTPQALKARLIEIIEKPRRFLRGDSYVGPDRRRRDQPDFGGPFRRAEDRLR